MTYIDEIIWKWRSNISTIRKISIEKENSATTDRYGRIKESERKERVLDGRWLVADREKRER